VKRSRENPVNPVNLVKGPLAFELRFDPAACTLAIVPASGEGTRTRERVCGLAALEVRSAGVDPAHLTGPAHPAQPARPAKGAAHGR
jgi:hypothetical protein